MLVPMFVHKPLRMQSHRTLAAFTLIELLVVIAIIGVLSVVVLASVQIARDKARDAAIKSDVDSIVTQTNIYYDNHANSYGTAVNSCVSGVYTDVTITNGLSIIQNTQNAAGTRTCYASGDKYGFAVTRPSSAIYTPDSTYWCADSTGAKCGINALTPLSSTGTCGC